MRVEPIDTNLRYMGESWVTYIPYSSVGNPKKRRIVNKHVNPIFIHCRVYDEKGHIILDKQSKFTLYA